MKVAVLSLVLLGVLAAVSAAVLIAALTARSEGQRAADAPKDPEVAVLVASRDLPEMSLVQGTSITTKKVLKSQVPADALLNPVQVVGKVITTAMVEGQPFTKASFVREGVGVSLAMAVPEGKRAMSVQLTDWSGMAGLLYPGSVVDVLVSYRSLATAAQHEELRATTLLQGLQVLAIGAQSIADEQYRDKETGAMAPRGQINFRMVTLLVDLKQAEILQLAMQSGSISLAMRNPRDTIREPRRETLAREIAPNRMGLTPVQDAAEPNDPFADSPNGGTPRAAAKAAAPADPKLWETMIIRGTVAEKRTFPMPKDHEAASGPTTRPAAISDDQHSTQPAAVRAAG